MNRKIFKFNSIRNSMILSFMILIAVIILLVSMLSYNNTIRDYESLSIRYVASILDEINARIDSYIENMKSMGIVVAENNDVRELLAFYNFHKDANLTPEQLQEREVLKERASIHMGNVAQTRSDITNIAIISKYGDIVLSDVNKQVNPYSAYNLTDWYLKPLSYKEMIVVSPSHIQTLIDGEYKWVISISKAVLDDLGDVTGVMVIDLNYRSIEDICESVQFGKNGYIYLVDGKKNLIYHPQQQLINAGIRSENIDKVFSMNNEAGYARANEENRIYIRSDSEITGWTAVGVVNVQELTRDKSYNIYFYFILAVYAIAVAGIFAVMISTSITQPIKKLEGTMHCLEAGDLDVQVEIEQDNEIGHLGKTFNKMVVQLRELMQNVVAKEEEKRNSEIKALQAQINPHFLYNTLDTIIWMSAGGKKDEVGQVASALAQLFRTSISSSDRFVPLKTEIENIESYLTIQKMRYKDKLTYQIEVPSELAELPIPKLILQPIVENAIYHGIKPSPVAGRILIKVIRQDNDLILCVEDDGVGMTREQLKNIFQLKPADSGGIGVLNVHNRIQLVYGEKYGLSYTDTNGNGTSAQIRLPVIIPEEGGQSDEA